MTTALAYHPDRADGGDALIAIVGALAVHGFAAWMAVSTLTLPSRDLAPIAQPQIIEAEVIDARVLEAEARRLREAAEAEQRAKDQALAEQRAMAEQKRIDDARLTAEREAADRRKLEAVAAKAKAEQEAKAREVAREKREAADQTQREKELKTQIAAEERRRKAEQSGALTAWMLALNQKVNRNWLRPAHIPDGLECVVRVEQLPTGDVVRATVTRCNGDEIIQRSIEDAVLKSSPLPTPSSRALYDRNIDFVFKPTK